MRGGGLVSRVAFGALLVAPLIVRIAPIFHDAILRELKKGSVTVGRMAHVKSRGNRFTSEETYAWLEKHLVKRGFNSLEDLSRASGIDRGTLSRYFRQERRPSVDVIAPLCEALNVAPETLLIVLGAVDRKR